MKLAAKIAKWYLIVACSSVAGGMVGMLLYGIADLTWHCPLLLFPESLVIAFIVKTGCGE